MFNLRSFLGLDYYTSELDQFLKQYDKSHPSLTPAQKFEKDKYRRVYQLRDKADQLPQETSFWDKF